MAATLSSSRVENPTDHVAAAAAHAAAPAGADARTADLTAAMSAGNESAVEAFYRLYFDMMLQTARRAGGRDEAFCLDVIQEAMLRIIRTVRPAPSEAQLAAWVRLVVRTTCYDLLRAEARRNRHESVAAVCTDAVARRCEPDASIEAEERLAWLRAEIARLDPSLVRAIDLRYERRWTLARVAQSLGLSVGTLDGRIRRALKQIRRQAMEQDDA